MGVDAFTMYETVNVTVEEPVAEASDSEEEIQDEIPF